MTLPKHKFPHIYEFQKLGKDETPEGREYMKEHQDQVDKEYSEVMDLWRDRYKIGGKEKIHEI